MRNLAFFLCLFISLPILAQTPPYCSSLTVCASVAAGCVTATLASVGPATASCPNGYPLWESSGAGGVVRVYRNASNCNQWEIYTGSPFLGSGIVSIATTATPTDNPPLTGWSSTFNYVSACSMTPYCTTLSVAASIFTGNITTTLRYVDRATASCPNGYPRWGFSNSRGEVSIYRDASNCNRWVIFEGLNVSPFTRGIVSEVITAAPTDNPPLTGWSSTVSKVTACNAPLPVRLMSFVAETKENKVELRWATTEERHNKGFEIEHSADAVLFKTIGFIDGHGTVNQQVRKYAFTDERSFPGINYYRLKQIDTDGNFEYSKVVSVVNDFGMGVFPNPAQTVLNLTLPQGFTSKIKLISNAGSTLGEWPVATMSQSIPISQITAGQYWVLFSDEAGRCLKTVKVVKQ